MSRETPTSIPLTRTRYGSAHPERVENDVWEQAMRENWSGYHVRRHHGVELRGTDLRQDFSHSAYRDTTPGPFWSWQRFGRTSTPLPDGRVIHIAGEHEDSYDSDFCIYNDVVVEYADGSREIFLYPKHVFPPTDFHSATLVGHEIVLIGSLGYRDMRRVGETQMLKLDTRTLRIEPVAAAGEAPGWISRHLVEKLGETSILVIGGMVQTADGYEPNMGAFDLDLGTMIWRRREHGDEAIFPISEALYQANKNPRFGKANPERSDNPFWLEMARRGWPPSRARLHFGDVAPPRPEFVFANDDAEPSSGPPEFGTAEAEARIASISAAAERGKLARTIDDVVWTAVREEVSELTLADGRKLLIGGEVVDFGDEYADPWVYNDVIVTHPGGAVEILVYPKEAFPQLARSVCIAAGKDVYIFGIVDRTCHPERSRGPAVLRLDTSSYKIAELPVAAPSARVNIYTGSEYRDGDRVVFPIVRDRRTDPELSIAFDLQKLVWSEPF
jgi:hypothetical protein